MDEEVKRKRASMAVHVTRRSCTDRDSDNISTFIVGGDSAVSLKTNVAPVLIRSLLIKLYTCINTILVSSLNNNVIMSLCDLLLFFQKKMSV